MLSWLKQSKGLEPLTIGGLIWMAAAVVWYLVDTPTLPALTTLALQWPDPVEPAQLGRALYLHASALTVALGIVMSGLAAGWLLARRLSARSALGDVVLSAALGLGVLGQVILLLGWLSAYQTPALVLLWVAGTVLFATAWPCGLGQTLGDARRELRACLAEVPWLIRLSAALPLGLGLLMALVPEVSYDALVYHLGAPRYLLVHGGLEPTMNVHYNYPLTFQMLYLWALGLQGDVAAKLIHWAAGALLAAAFLAWASERGRPAAGGWSAAMLLAMPMTQLVMWTAGVDLGAALLAVCAVWCWSRELDAGPGPAAGALTETRGSELRPAIPGGWGGLLLTGMLAGLCYATKLTAALVLPLAVALSLLSCRSSTCRPHGRLTRVAVLGLGAALIIVPWMLRAWSATGNPIYPFLGSVLGGLDPVSAAQMQEDVRGLSPDGWLAWMALPWTLTFSSMTSISWPGPGILMMLPICLVELLRRQHSGSSRRLVSLLILTCLVMACINRSTRYWLPYLALLLAPMGWAVDGLGQRSPRAGAVVTWATALVGLIGLASVMPVVIDQYRPLSVLTGAMTQERYRSISHPPALSHRPPEAMYRWVARELPADSKILVLGEERVAGLEHRFAVAGVYDEPLLVAWSREPGGEADLLARMRLEGVTHLLVNPAEGLRLLDYGVFSWPEQTLVAFCRLWERHVELVHVAEVQEPYLGSPTRLYLYELAEKERARPRLAPACPVLRLYEEALMRSLPEEHRTVESRVALMRRLAEQSPDVWLFRRRLAKLETQATSTGHH